MIKFQAIYKEAGEFKQAGVEAEDYIKAIALLEEMFPNAETWMRKKSKEEKENLKFSLWVRWQDKFEGITDYRKFCILNSPELHPIDIPGNGQMVCSDYYMRKRFYCGSQPIFFAFHNCGPAWRSDRKNLNYLTEHNGMVDLFHVGNTSVLKCRECGLRIVLPKRIKYWHQFVEHMVMQSEFENRNCNMPS